MGLGQVHSLHHEGATGQVIPHQPIPTSIDKGNDGVIRRNQHSRCNNLRVEGV